LYFGIFKTVIPNIAEVAYSLHRSPGEVNKFFGTELGAQVKYTAETDKAIVNGAHTDGTLQELMHRYIEKFVLCPNCGLPESEYKIKSDCIFHRCKACGAKEMVDMSHKLCNFILAEDKKARKEAKSKDKKLEKDDDKVRCNGPSFCYRFVLLYLTLRNRWMYRQKAGLQKEEEK
jgi:translation initiation factor 5